LYASLVQKYAEPTQPTIEKSRFGAASLSLPPTASLALGACPVRLLTLHW